MVCVCVCVCVCVRARVCVGEFVGACVGAHKHNISTNACMRMDTELPASRNINLFTACNATKIQLQLGLPSYLANYVQDMIA